MMKILLCCLLLVGAGAVNVDEPQVTPLEPELLDESMSMSNDVEDEDGPDDSPDWTLGKGEAPKGVKDMHGWTMHVFTPEQERRMGVNMYGQPKVFNGDFGASGDTANHNDKA